VPVFLWTALARRLQFLVPKSVAEEGPVNNDKVFSAYALILVSGVASMITATVMAGVATLPTLAVFLEHLMLSLLFRAAYKSIGGFDWVFFLGPDTYTFEPRETPTPGAGTADALS
jgi:hypothetical protein